MLLQLAEPVGEKLVERPRLGLSAGRFPVSDHCDGRRFFNLSGSADRTLMEVLRWQTAGTRKPWPRWVERGEPERVPTPSPGQLLISFVNQSTFLLQTDHLAILTDPIWSKRASPLRWAGPRRVCRPGVRFDDLPPVGLVLISHNHYDHMDLPTLRCLEMRFRPLFLTGLGNGPYLRRRGLGRIEELDWWQSYRPAEGDEVTMTPAQHFSARSLFDRDRTLWGGFVLTLAGRQVYFAGDTGYGDHFRTIRARLGPPDVALLPIGAYEPRWFMQPAHVNPAEAVLAHQELGARQSVAMHFGTFQLTDEGIDEPVEALRAALRTHRLSQEVFHVPRFGETVPIPAP
jgi:L-ascorbate metabolism protein UlaG (beta-lactamase superfamily)